MLAISYADPDAKHADGSLATRLTRLRHFSNLFEIDYEFHPRVNAHVGYRYTDRSIDLEPLDLEVGAPPPADPEIESFDNRTNTFIFGLRAKALRHARRAGDSM